jgi:hypothetical protein
MAPKRAAGTLCCGNDGRNPKTRASGALTKRKTLRSRGSTERSGRKGLNATASRGVTAHATGTVEDDNYVEDVCLTSITIHLDGQRTRYGFIEDASLRTRRSDDVSHGGSTDDVVMSEEYTLREAVELCDDVDSKVVGVTVDVHGMDDVALHSGKVRCWFVYKSAGGVDYTESANGAGHTWARMRYTAPLEESSHPLYKAANFLEPACMVNTCPLAEKGLSGGCQRMGKRYCDKPGNMRSQWCSSFFASPDSNVDDLLKGYCEKALSNVSGRLLDLDPRDRKLCGCFYPQNVYDNYFKRMKGKSLVSAPCSFSPCANSNYLPYGVKTGAIVCPTVVECNQECNIKVTAKTVDQVTCKQNCLLNVDLAEAAKNKGTRAYTARNKRTRSYRPGATRALLARRETDHTSFISYGPTMAIGLMLLACCYLYFSNAPVKSKPRVAVKSTPRV